MNPYQKYLGERDALEVLRETPQVLQSLVEKIGAEGMKRTWTDGKWTAEEIILHLVHVEFILGSRVRYALTTENYTVQPFEQAAWIERESATSGIENLQILISLRKFNLRLFETITDEEKEIELTHPDLGDLKVKTLLEIYAGHDLNHQQHLVLISQN